MGNTKIVKAKLNKTVLTPLKESINFNDFAKSLDMRSVLNHFSITDIPKEWDGLALEFPAATLVFDLAGSSIGIRDRGAIDYIRKNQEIFSELTNLAYENDGIIEKFPGDGISMHFPTFEHELYNKSILRAFNALCSMITYLENVQKLKRSQFRFSLAYGQDTVVTKFGNDKHEELISIGHAVNVAHKLEKYVKDELCFIGLDEKCYEICKGSIQPTVNKYYLDRDLWCDTSKTENWYGVKY